jgi:hypothetical protein
MIAAGYYDAQITAHGLIADDDNQANPVQYAIEFEIADEGPHQGDSITWFGYFSDAAFPYTIEKLRRAGFVGTDLRNLARADDKPVRIGIKHETYQGQIRAKVTSIGGGSIVASRQVSTDKAAAFACKMEQRIKAWDAKAGSPSPRSAGTRPAPGNSRSGSTNDPIGGERDPGSDDIPF